MQRLRRGGNLVSPDGTVHNVRLKRHLKDQKKIGAWSWAKCPFTSTREWYGLRVLMAVMNNWDLKDSNNSVYLTHGEPPALTAFQNAIRGQKKWNVDVARYAQSVDL